MKTYHTREKHLTVDMKIAIQLSNSTTLLGKALSQRHINNSIFKKLSYKTIKFIISLLKTQGNLLWWLSHTTVEPAA